MGIAKRNESFLSLHDVPCKSSRGRNESASAPTLNFLAGNPGNCSQVQGRFSEALEAHQAGVDFFTCRLALGVQGVDVHGEVEFVANDLLVLASKFVGTIDALGVPVCPIQAVFKHRDGKGVREAWGKSRRTSVYTWPVQLAPGPRPGNRTNLTLCQRLLGAGTG